jgi:xanthine dehydrogenase accessory factor
MEVDALETARQLTARGEAFALATVVWRRAPSSGQIGAKAVITADGGIRGWLAGACAEPAVIAEARKALAEGMPRLVFLGSPEELAEHGGRDGVVSVPIACQSEGALEIYIEPVLPKPHIVAIGRSPVAAALVRLASALGWRATLVNETASGEGDVDAVGDLDAAQVGERSAVVVATQGHYDEEALERALATPAAYVGLVASRKRAWAVLEYLRDRGVSGERLAQVHAPAGLDLGSVPTEEIAVAIMAEMVQLKASGAFGGGVAEASASAVHEERDPVCGMGVLVATARHRAINEGRTFYFCSAGCKKKFEHEPQRFGL